MRRNDIENIARILRKRSPVRVGTIVGFEDDGKVVQVRFHDTKLPEGQFERKLACEGIIEGSVFTLIQPNFSRPVSDLVDIEKEVGTGGLKGLTLPLVGFETYPEGSENPDCIIGLFELPGGSIYREVLTEARNDILIPGYSTFQSQKAIGEDEIRRIELMPWFGPHRFREVYRIASTNNRIQIHTTKEGLQKTGVAFVDKVMSIRTTSDESMEPARLFKTLQDSILIMSDVANAFEMPVTDKHLMANWNEVLLFCEGISLFEYFERELIMLIKAYRYLSQTARPEHIYLTRSYNKARRFLIKAEDGLYMSKDLMLPWIQNTSSPPNPLDLEYNQNNYNYYGALRINKISYDLADNTVKITGDPIWLEEPTKDKTALLPGNGFQVEFLNDPKLAAAIPRLNKSGEYFGIERIVTADEYENNTIKAYPVFVPESDPLHFHFSMGSRPEVWSYYEGSLSDKKRVAYSDPVIVEFDWELETQEIQVLIAEGSFRPFFIIEPPERVNLFMTQGGLIHNWEMTNIVTSPAMIPHMVNLEKGIVSSFLTQEEYSKGVRLKNEVTLKLSNIDLPTDWQRFHVTATRVDSFNKRTEHIFDPYSVRCPFFTKTVENIANIGGEFPAILAKVGIGFSDWNFTPRVFLNYEQLLNRKTYTNPLDWVQVKEMYFAGTVIEGKPYKLPGFDMLDSNITMEYSYGERSQIDYGYDPSNGGYEAPSDMYKTTTPRYDTGANATNRWAPDDITVDIDYVEVYKITGASYDPWTGNWNWTWEEEPCRSIIGSEVEKIEPYPNIRVPILAGEMTELGGRWHLPRLVIHYKKLKAGDGLSAVPFFCIRFRSIPEAIIELPLAQAEKVIKPDDFGLFSPWVVQENLIMKLVPKFSPVYGPIEFPETDDSLLNSIRSDMVGITGATGITSFVVNATTKYYLNSSLVLEGPAGNDEAFFLPLEESLDHLYEFSRGAYTKFIENYPITGEMVQPSTIYTQFAELPSDVRISRLRLDRAKLMFDKLILNDNLTSAVINPSCYGIMEG